MDKKYSQVGSLYVRVAEECSELIHIMMKIERFGLFNFHPYNPVQLNLEQAFDELSDLEQVVGELKSFLFNVDIEELSKAKKKMIEAYRELDESDVDDAGFELEDK